MLHCSDHKSNCIREFVAIAGWVARIGSGLFLCVQILMLLDFVVTWNDSWVDMEDHRQVFTSPHSSACV